MQLMLAAEVVGEEVSLVSRLYAFRMELSRGGSTVATVFCDGYGHTMSLGNTNNWLKDLYGLAPPAVPNGWRLAAAEPLQQLQPGIRSSLISLPGMKNHSN